MQGLPQQKPGVKRLGDLLVEAGYVSAADLNRALEISKKNFQSLGKVLVSSKVCKELDVNTAVDIQKLCKLENMSGAVAVRVLTAMRVEMLSRNEALRQVGWTHETYVSYQEPEDVVKAKLELQRLTAAGGVPYALALEKLGDAYLKHHLPARGEVYFEDAATALEALLPASARELSATLSKLGKLAFQQKRHEDAKNFIHKAKTCLEDHGHHKTKEYAKVLHVTAEHHVARRKYAEAERYYIESFNMLLPDHSLQDPQLLETIWRYAETVAKNVREKPEKVTLGELFKGSGMLTEEQLTHGWQHSKYTKIALGRALVMLGLISEAQLQLALQVQMLVRNGEVSAQLGVWIVLYAVKLGYDLDKVLETLHCQLSSRSVLSGELRSASNEMATMEARLPSNHPDLAFAHAKVGNIYFQRQQFLEADHHFKRALTIFSASPTSFTEKALEVIDQYCDLKSATDDLDEAVRIAKIAVQMRLKHYGEVSIPYSKGLEKLAGIYIAKGEYLVAVRCLDQALVTRAKLYGKEDRELIGCLEAKGEALAQAADYAAAEVAFDRALEIAENVYGHAHDITERITIKLAQVCRDAGNVGKAKELLPGRNLSDQLYM